ncbi:hypothetical protein ILUMI_08698 [Ignelater luminosus]|uniref:Uncharacterized protein n=1 Tax=Ignelater luminosus TaxID=2038154 RepID=A0A8K0D581_IGNLU|nr:hypothetical protein ILUMI_08698 [Ignelater luminosus]
MSRVDLRHRWIVRPGELHTAFAMIRGIGCFVGGTEIPDLWSVLYGDNTVSQIISAPELQRVSQETLNMYGSSLNQKARKRHKNNKTSAKDQDKTISILYGKLERIGNPFKSESPEFMNIATKAVFSKQVTSDDSRIESLGRELYKAFKSDRLLDGSIARCVTELNADRSLFARILIVARSQREVDLRTTLRKYEMSAVPRSMFAQDGTMHQCPAKTTKQLDCNRGRQALDKTIGVKTCANNADLLTQKIQRKCWQYDEFHTVFDVNLDKSIKNLARDKRLSNTVQKLQHCPNFTHYQVATPPEVCLEKESYHTSVSDEERITLQKLGTSDSVPDDTVSQLEEFIYRVYQPQTSTISLAECGQCLRTSKPLAGDGNKVRRENGRNIKRSGTAGVPEKNQKKKNQTNH